MSRFNPVDSGYIEVKDRVIEFYGKYPQGSFQTEIVHLNADAATKDSPGLVVIKALAYRTADDIRPGIGHSQMQIPGKTSFTEGSEIENAETSAIGRAIAALGFSVHRSYASANEVANKQEEKQDSSNLSEPTPLENPHSTKEQRDELLALATSLNITKDEMGALRKAHTDKAKSSEFTVADVAAMKKAVIEAAAIKSASGGEIVA